MKAKANGLALLLALASSLLAAGCFDWQYDTTVDGVAFSKVREEKGLVTGFLKEDTVIGGRPCRRGWVHIRGAVPVGFTAAREIDLARFRIPAGTWVSQDDRGVVRVCSFPEDVEIQGHVCRGGWGGSEGVQAAFYPDGALKQYFLRHDTRIQGVPCKAGAFGESIELHENGALKACMLSEAIVRDGRPYAVGERIRFDPEGRVIP